MDGKSKNIVENKIEQMKELFPEVFAEDKIDWEKLQATLGENVDFTNERYVLNWAGKSEAFRTLQAPTTATLVPDRDESVNFDTTQNLFIEGENLEVLKVLQKSYFNKVKMIYIDPPYNTGNDHFIYPDKFSESRDEYMKRVGDKDEEGYLMKEGLFRKNSKDSGHYHSNWLSMMYPRLFLARSLLRDDGVIFVSIDDNEVHNLRLLMNEVFGEENFLGAFAWHRRQNADNRNITNISLDHEYLICYKSHDFDCFVGRFIDTTKYKNPDNDPRGKWASIDLTGLATIHQRPNLHFNIIDPENGAIYPPNPDRGWSKSKDTIEKMIIEKRILFQKI
jgi:adenine-specific DNA-methyltransferase